MESEIDFGVETKDVYVEGKIVPKKVAIVRDDNRLVIAIVGSRYKVVDHKKIIYKVDDTLEENKYFFDRRDNVCRGGARIYCSYQFEGIEFNIGLKDKVTLTMILTNSYDSGSRIRFDLGGHRLCTNANLAVSKKLVSFSGLHTTNFRSEDFIKRTTDAIQEYSDNVIPFWNRLYDHEITTDEGLLLIEQICKKDFPKRYAGDVSTKWSAPFIDEDKPRNLWVLYNAFTTFIHQNMEDKKFERSLNLKQTLDEYFYRMV